MFKQLIRIGFGPVDTVFVIIIHIVKCGLVTLQHSHVTPLVQVGAVTHEGNGCGGGREGVGVDVCRHGVVCGHMGVVVIMCGGHWWKVVGVGIPIPMVPVFGCPIITVSKLVFELICTLGGS